MLDNGQAFEITSRRALDVMPDHLMAAERMQLHPRSHPGKIYCWQFIYQHACGRWKETGKYI